MDKVKAVLVYKFWILFAFALILPTYGWWSATNAVKAETDSRKTAVVGSFKNAETLKGESPKIPNDDWTDALTNLNAMQVDRYRKAVAHLWELQQELKVWPAVVRKDISEVEPGGLIYSKTCFLYKGAFQEEVQRVYNILKPIDPETKQGVVSVDLDTIESALELDIPEGGQSPDSDSIWTAQEDIWLMTGIMEALARVNENANATSVVDAPLKALEDVELRGGGKGQPAKAKRGTSSKPKKKKRSSNRGDDDDEEEMAAAKQKKRGGKRVASYRVESGVSFTGDDEFGEKNDGVRYIDLKGNFPYKKRGFVLTVVVHQKRVPDLIAELTNMPFPTRIVRYQQEAMTDGLPGNAKRSGVAGGRQQPGQNRRSEEQRRPRGLSFGGGGDNFEELNWAEKGAINAQRSANRRMTAEQRAAQQRQARESAGGGVENAALADPTLARVVIAGEMTIYDTPEGKRPKKPAPGKK